MNPQETNKLLEEMMFEVMKLRSVQVQVLAESSNHEPATKIKYREQANAAYKRFQELHKQLSDSLQHESAQT